MKLFGTMLMAGLATLSVANSVQLETLRWGVQRDILSLDPHSYGDTFTIAAMNHVYEGLVRYDANLAIEPALAESWAIADDNVTWTFTLRRA